MSDFPDDCWYIAGMLTCIQPLITRSASKYKGKLLHMNQCLKITTTYNSEFLMVHAGSFCPVHVLNTVKPLIMFPCSDILHFCHLTDRVKMCRHSQVHCFNTCTRFLKVVVSLVVFLVPVAGHAAWFYKKNCKYCYPPWSAQYIYFNIDAKLGLGKY